MRAGLPSLMRVTVWAAVASVLWGCGGTRNFENENDRLRAEQLELQRQVAQLERKLALRTDELQAARQQLDGDATPIDGVEAPRLARIRFGRYTGAVDIDQDGRDDAMRVYLEPLDGQGRFIPVAGQATVKLVAIPPSDPPQVLAERTFPPAELDDAYRAGFLGAYYTLEVPLPQPLPQDVDQVTLHVVLTDGPTGVTFTEQQVVPLSRYTRSGD